VLRLVVRINNNYYPKNVFNQHIVVTTVRKSFSHS